MALLTLLSLINVTDLERALWGKFSRGEGLYVILSYYD